MLKLKALLLTQGMHGMISQVEGLAKALDIDFTHHTVEQNSFWKVIPPKLTPISGSVYKKLDHSNFDVIISCGRKSVIPSIHFQRIQSGYIKFRLILIGCQYMYPVFPYIQQDLIQFLLPLIFLPKCRFYFYIGFQFMMLFKAIHYT